MRFSFEILPYLRGEAFSGSLRIPFLEEKEPLPPWWLGRSAYLEQVLAGRSVIHVGCADHGPEHAAARIAKGTFLHQRLIKIAFPCAGVDIDAEGIRYLAETLGLAEVYCADLATEDVPALQKRHWDVLLLGEVIKHLDDPVAFLTGVRKRYGGCIGSLLATVPNAFAWDNMRQALKGEERINTDHRYWFTPYTLAKVLIRAGFVPKTFHCMSLNPFIHLPIWKSFYRRRKAKTHRFLDAGSLSSAAQYVGDVGRAAVDTNVLRSSALTARPKGSQNIIQTAFILTSGKSCQPFGAMQTRP